MQGAGCFPVLSSSSVFSTPLYYVGYMVNCDLCLEGGNALIIDTISKQPLQEPMHIIWRNPRIEWQHAFYISCHFLFSECSIIFSQQHFIYQLVAGSNIWAWYIKPIYGDEGHQLAIEIVLNPFIYI